jgi:translation elongation factor EF-G
MKDAMKRMELFPLFCVSSTHNYGTRAVLSTIVELMPNAYEMEEIHAFSGAEGDQRSRSTRTTTRPSPRWCSRRRASRTSAT